MSHLRLLLVSPLCGAALTFAPCAKAQAAPDVAATTDAAAPLPPAAATVAPSPPPTTPPTPPAASMDPRQPAAADAGVAAPAHEVGPEVDRVNDMPPGGKPYHGYKDRLGWYVPDYVKVQTGGFLGAFIGAIGYAFWVDRINWSLQYGYMPPYNGAPHVQIFSTVLSFRPVRIDFGRSIFAVPLYLGVGGMVARGPNLFVSQPSAYPKGYYPPTSIQYLALVGLEVGARGHEGDILTRQSLFAELVTINQYIDAAIDNRNFKLLDGISSAVGYRASF